MIHQLSIAEIRAYKHNITNAPHGAYVKTNSSHMVVYFGSYSGEFRGTHTIEQIGCNGLFVRSSLGTWYMESHPLGKTPPDVAATITKFIASECPHVKTVTLAGFSMGAFAALLYATWIPANKVVANAAQTKVPTHASVEIYADSQYVSYFDIRNVWETFGPPNCHVRLAICETDDPEDDFHDSAAADNIRHFSNVNLISYPCYGHKEIGQHLLRDNYNSQFLP